MIGNQELNQIMLRRLPSSAQDTGPIPGWSGRFWVQQRMQMSYMMKQLILFLNQEEHQYLQFKENLELVITEQQDLLKQWRRLELFQK